MLSKNSFQKPKNPLESYEKYTRTASPDVPGEVCIPCPSCAGVLFNRDLEKNLHVCPKCGYHFRLGARRRIEITVDPGSFRERESELRSKNPIDFPQYEKKLNHAFLTSGEHEAVVCGEAKIGGYSCALFVMEPFFMMGSMGSVVGEKITRLFEYAQKKNLPVVGFTVSGGARMQEGIFSLMQMAKTSGAVKKHSDAGNLYTAILTDPTTGGVTASFAMEADVILAEPNALVGFAGPRVIRQTMKQKLPEGFQSAEFLYEKGFVDSVVERNAQKQFLTTLLSLHSTEGKEGA